MSRWTPIPETVTLHVSFRIVKRGGRKEMQMPGGIAPSRINNNMLVKALARAFRWKRMLGTGEFTTIAELAARRHCTDLNEPRPAPDIAFARYR